MAKKISVAFTAKGREKKALQAAVAETGIDPQDLTYTEDKRSKTAKVVDKETGRTVGRIGW